MSALEASALSPAEVHPQQHFGPVLGICAAGAGMDGEDGVAGVVRAGELELEFELDEAPSTGTVRFCAVSESSVSWASSDQLGC